jgi:flagellar hook-basal body complex protein FliE
MDISAIMSKVIPGTFVPDMNASQAPTVSPIPGLSNAPADAAKTGADTGAVPTVGGTTSFKDTVKQMLSDVNDSINTSDQNTRDLATGKTHDVNRVVTSVEEANLALQYTMAIRTKLLEAYSEVERMSV